MEAKSLWLLNLDAELELARGTAPYQPTAPVIEQVRRNAALAARALPPGAVWFTHGEEPPIEARKLPGFAWSPTRFARSTLERFGVASAAAPPHEVLVRVNHRRFAQELAAPLPGARYVSSADELETLLGDRSVTGSWLCKRPFGFAGRGQRRIGATLSADDRRWLDDSLGQGGFVAEPFVNIERELCVHGFVTADAKIRLGAICEQHVDDTGAFVSIEHLANGVISDAFEKQLYLHAELAANALEQAGYFGPFGVDAFTYVEGTRRRFNPLSELNARLTMGYAEGMRSTE